MVFVLRQLQKYQEQNKGLFVALIDRAKAFNTAEEECGRSWGDSAVLQSS